MFNDIGGFFVYFFKISIDQELRFVIMINEEST